MTKGLNSYTVTFLDNTERRQTWERFATNLRQAVISAEQALLKEYGFDCLLISVKETDPAQNALCNHIGGMFDE